MFYVEGRQAYRQSFSSIWFEIFSCSRVLLTSIINISRALLKTSRTNNTPKVLWFLRGVFENHRRETFVVQESIRYES